VVHSKRLETKSKEPSLGKAATTIRSLYSSWCSSKGVEALPGYPLPKGTPRGEMLELLTMVRAACVAAVATHPDQGNRRSRGSTV